MNLSVAVGMDQDAVLRTVYATQRFVYDVVVMPASYLRDRLVTDWAATALFFPEVRQPTFSVQGLFHLHAEAFFKVDFPCRIVGIAGSFDLFIPGSWCCRGQAKQVADGLSILAFCLSEEAPVLVSDLPKVAVFYPSLAFLRMGSVSKVEMTTPIALICKALFLSISTFEPPPWRPTASS